MGLSSLYNNIFRSKRQDEEPKKEKNKKKQKQKECFHREVSSAEPCAECKMEKKAARKYRWTIILGLFFPFTLQGLDSTIIASALPWIANDFNKESQQNWIVASFTLASAALIPFWAQVSDIFGRTVSLSAAITFMVVGSILCTAAPITAFPMLLLGRGLQGLAAAGLNVVVRTILADKVSLQENARNWATFSLVGGISYALGPVIGGYLTDANWRWCFAINLPIGVVALILVFFILRKHLLGPQPIPELNESSDADRKARFVMRLKTVDFGGQVLFLLGFGLIILAMTWGGATYPWSSPAVIAPLVVGLVLSGLFIYWEYLLSPGQALAIRMPWQKPMVPWSLMRTKNIGLLFYSECATGIGMYAVLYFCNIYFMSVKGYNSDKAGTQLLYFTPGLGLGVYICHFLCNVYPRMTFPPVFVGTIIETVGLGMLAYGMYTEKLGIIYGMMALVGCGSGIRFMASPLHGIGLFRENRSSVIGLMAVALPFGGTIGLTIMSTVFNNVSGHNSDGDSSNINSLSGAERDTAIHQAKMGVVWAYVAVTPLVGLAILCASCLGNVKLGQGPPGENGPTDIVIKGSYLLSLLQGDKGRTDLELGHAPLGSSHGWQPSSLLQKHTPHEQVNN